MEPQITFLTTLLTFPAILPGILLSLVVLYWLFVILGALDIDSLDFDFDGDDANLLYVVGMPGIPSSISISLLTFNLWLISVPATYYLLLWFAEGIIAIVLGCVVLFIGFIMAAQLTIQLIKPWRKFFTEASATSSTELVGKTCIISTAEVTEDFGQANYEDGGAGLILSVRANTPNKLSRDSRALILEYDKQQHIYHVTELDEF